MVDCPECGVAEGHFHEELCPLEECPGCGGDYYICDCVFTWPPEGRRPWVYWPNICGRCAEKDPEIFRVPDEEWKRVVGVARVAGYLCPGCYDEIKGLVENA